mgnify:CR=1 FL=1
MIAHLLLLSSLYLSDYLARQFSGDRLHFSGRVHMTSIFLSWVSKEWSAIERGMDCPVLFLHSNSSNIVGTLRVLSVCFGY